MSGRAILEKDSGDKPIGFLFWAQRDGFDQQTVYDGRVAYVADTSKRTYRMISNPSPNLFFSTTGGQMIVEDLIQLDTSSAVGITASENQDSYSLTLNYPDLREHDVIKRYKLVTIDKKTMLPISVKQHQETLGKVQDLNFQILELKTSQEQQYDFSEPLFLRNYLQEAVPIRAENTLLRLKGNMAPVMELPSFEDTKKYPILAKGKVTLLDFWEVWCAPCIASMPKVQQLYDRYKEVGLQVYGITHEADQLETARKRVEKSKVTFPMLMGNEHSRKAYHLSAIPLYILIDKYGKVVYLSEGFSDELEREIQKALAD
ncbi:hypothetical protein GCM10027275_25640 [Rhabdobacter roseus]